MERESSALIETLTRKGWCFRDTEEVKYLIQIHVATLATPPSADSIESDLLLNTDLRSIGGKSLPLDLSSHLQGPKVLQIVSTRDISLSSVEASSRSSSNRRLLRICLTDGHSELVSIEYTPLTSIHDDIVPGTKIRLENKVAINSGIACLNPKAVTVLGGMVQTLYEEWQMNRKYSGFSRSSLKPQRQEGDGDGPPLFEKFQIDTHSQKSVQRVLPDSVTIQAAPDLVKADSKNLKGKNNSGYPHKDVGTSATGSNEQTTEKPSTSESRPKEVSEAVPVQNQAAAQKLLQKMSQPSRNDRHIRGPKHRGKGREEETTVFTLDEWEKRKGEVKPLVRNDLADISHDEQLARQLQEQLDLEAYKAQASQESEAEKIRMSMFSFHRMEEDRNQGRGRGGVSVDACSPARILYRDMHNHLTCIEGRILQLTPLKAYISIDLLQCHQNPTACVIPRRSFSLWWPSRKSIRKSFREYFIGLQSAIKGALKRVRASG